MHPSDPGTMGVTDSCDSICIKDVEKTGMNLGKSANIMSHIFP